MLRLATSLGYESEAANLSPACGKKYWRDFDRLVAAVLYGRP